MQCWILYHITRFDCKAHSSKVSRFLSSCCDCSLANTTAVGQAARANAATQPCRALAARDSRHWTRRTSRDNAFRSLHHVAEPPPALRRYARSQAKSNTAIIMRTLRKNTRSCALPRNSRGCLPNNSLKLRRRRECLLATNARPVPPLPDDPFLEKRPQLLYQIFFCGARGCLEPPCCSSQLKTVTRDYPSR